MEKILYVLMFCWAAVCPANAQFYFRGGYQIGSSPNKVLNDIVQRYNEAHPGQTMAAMNLMHGPAASIGGRFGGFTMDLGWKRLRQLNSAPAMDSLGNPANRDLIARSDNFNYGLVADVYTSEVVSFCAGLTLDFNMFALLTQVTGQDKRTLGSASGLGIGAQFPILVHFGGGVGVEMVPYVSYPFHRTDLYPAVQELDPANAAALPADGFKQAFLNYGAAFYIRFGGFPD
jgi:hypothetical protein